MNKKALLIFSVLGAVGMTCLKADQISDQTSGEEAKKPAVWIGRWQTGSDLQSDAKASKPLGLYRDVACTLPASEPGDLVMAIRDEQSGPGTVLKQVDPEKCATLQLVEGRPVLRFDGVDDHYSFEGSVPLDALDIWLRYRINRAPQSPYATMLGGASDGRSDYLENGFRFMALDYQRSTAQNVMHVARLNLSSGSGTLSVEGVPISEVVSRSGTATRISLGSGLAPIPKHFVAMDVEALYIGVRIPQQEYAFIDRHLGSKSERPRLVCVGDSLTDGSHGGHGVRPTEEYPSELQRLRPERLVINSEKWGAQVASLLPVDQFLTSGGQLVVLVGTNNLPSMSVDETLQALSNYCTERRKKGWEVYVGTILPRSFTGAKAPPVDFEEKRQEFNERLREDYLSIADGLIDFAGDSRIGYTGADKDPTYYLADQVHLTAKGAQVLADLVHRGLPMP